MGLDRIEISPSGRAKCVACKKTIGEGTPRGVLITSNQRFGDSSSYVCYKCSADYIQNEILYQITLKKELEKKIKENIKPIIAMNL